MNRNRWFVTAVVVIATSVAFMIWAAVFPLLPVWIRDLGISRTQGGVLAALFYIPGFFVALPGGWLFDRFSTRNILLCAWVLVVLGTATMAFAPQFLTLCAGRLILSVGVQVHQVGAPKLLGVWFAGRRELGLVMAFYTWSFTIGVFTSLTLLGKVAAAAGWRPAMYLLLGLTAVAVLALAALPRDHPSGAGREQAAPPFRPFRLGLPVWVAACTYLLYNAGSDAYYTFTPDYLVTRGYDVARAAFLVGVYAWIAFTLKPVFAIFLNRRTAPLYITAGSLVAIGAFMLLLAPHVFPLVVTALIGVSIALCMPSLLALPAFLLPTRLSGQGYGLLMLFGSLEVLAAPLVGYSIDRTGGHLWAYVLLSVFCGLAAAGGLVLHFLVRGATARASRQASLGQEGFIVTPGEAGD